MLGEHGDLLVLADADGVAGASIHRVCWVDIEQSEGGAFVSETLRANRFEGVPEEVVGPCLEIVIEMSSINEVGVLGGGAVGKFGEVFGLLLGEFGWAEVGDLWVAVLSTVCFAGGKDFEASRIGLDDALREGFV